MGRLKNMNKLREIVIIGILCLPLFNCAQNSKFIDSLFYEKPTIKEKKIVKPKFKYNPIGYLGTGALFVYQNIISEQIQASCSYQISCSEFTKQCIHNYGFLKGTFIGLNQLLSCVPFAIEDTSPYFITPTNLIINEHYLKK